jgi:hypothetical protein
MFVRAQFLSPKQAVLAIPRSAVVDTGSRRIVYVASAGNEYTPREVSLGDPGNDFYPVLAGLREGERVVANGAFLVDSQTRLSGAMSGMFGGAKEFKNEKQPAPADAYKLEVQFQPDPPHAGNTSVLVPLADAAGKPVADAQVKVSFVMPAMPSMNMPEMRAAADLHWDAARKAYTGTVAVPMAGPYNVVAQASRAGRLLAEAHARTNAQ